MSVQPVPHILYLSDLVIFAVLNICQNVRFGRETWRDLWFVKESANQVVLHGSFFIWSWLITFDLVTLLSTQFFWVGYRRWQTFTTLFDLSLVFDIFWWSVTFYKSFEFLIRFCLIRWIDTKLVTDINIWFYLIVFRKWVTELKLRHLHLFLLPLRSAQLFFRLGNNSNSLHVRFWNRVWDWLDKKAFINVWMI